MEEYKIQLASNYLNPERINNAEKIYDDILKANPEYYKAHEGLFKVYLLKKDSVKALASLKKTITYAEK